MNFFARPLDQNHLDPYECGIWYTSSLENRNLHHIPETHYEFSWYFLVKYLNEKASSRIGWTTQTVLPVAFDTLSRTFGWPILFFASFSKYSTTLISRCFIWLLRCFPWKVYLSWEIDLSPLCRLFALEVAAELKDAISFTLKGKYVNYIIARYYEYLRKPLCNY